MALLDAYSEAAVMRVKCLLFCRNSCDRVRRTDAIVRFWPGVGICSEFRKLVERSVEDDLLNKAVQRHRRSITTDGRLSSVPTVNLDDCKLIDGLMTKYSCYEHSQSTEAPAFIPEKLELRADLESLKKWRDDLATRRATSAAIL